MSLIFKFTKKFIWNRFLDNGFQNRDIKADDLVIDYWDNNRDSEAIILLHGFGVQTEYQWYKQIAILSQKYRVIVPNLLYFGKTVQNNKYQLQDQINLVKIIVERLRLQKFDLMGLSYGGLIAIEFCVQNKEIVNKLILIDSPIKYLTTNDLETICQVYQINKIEELFAPRNYIGFKKQFKAAYYLKQFIPNFIYKVLYDNLCLPNIENWERLIVELKSNLELYAQKEYLIEHSILLVWGEYDDIIPTSIGSQLKNHLKNSKLEVIKKSKHLPNIEQSSQFNKIMMNFLGN
ncbi:hypothetical protein AD998_21475 [bacterium 336/3]|nr:hypothetical protein AD998_21475 [bacterium 336/3]